MPLDAARGESLARLALGHVARPWPHKADHVMGGPEDVVDHRILHPAFPGSFDWHSCVHAHWMLARILRRFPGLPAAPAVRAQFDAALSPVNIAAERAYLDRPLSRGFERPYGWAWLLALAAELEALDGPWAATLHPLAEAFAQRFHLFLPRADYPLRAGTHGNTAFALRLAAHWAEGRDAALLDALRDKARAWYGADTDCQAWEPSGDDFLSPALMEAECLRALLPQGEFAAWMARFLPRLAQGAPATLFTPARVADRSDGKIAHLDGLNLSRAWCWRSLAGAWPAGSPLRVRTEAAAEAHLAAALPHLSTDYMGEHWLATFAVLAMEGAKAFPRAEA
jgi:hypothetical protein